MPTTHRSLLPPLAMARLGVALVCLGATAGQALVGASVRVGRDRGRPLDSTLAELVTITTHPSSILRAQSDQEREEAFEAFAADLREVARWLRRAGG